MWLPFAITALLVLLHHTSHHTAVCGFWFYCSVSAAAVLPLVLEALLQQSRRYGMTLLGSGSTVSIAAYAVQPEEPASGAVELSRTPVTGRWGLSASVAVCEALGVAWSSHAESHPHHTMVVRVEVVTITGGSTRERAVEQTVDTPWVLESQVRRRVLLQRHRERALTPSIAACRHEMGLPTLTLCSCVPWASAREPLLRPCFEPSGARRYVTEATTHSCSACSSPG